MSALKSTRINLALFFLALAGTIAGELGDDQWLVLVFKPFLAIILSSWFYFNTRRLGDRFTLLIQVGLFFSLVGDVALVFQNVDQFNFLIGLGAFLLAQLCYGLAFAQNIADSFQGRSIILPLSITGVLVAYAFFLISELIPYVDGAILLPVVIYACAITLMGIAAAFRYGRTFPRSFAMVLTGAILFIASDSMLAVDRFIKPMEHASWSVLLSYGVAQVLIVSGCLLHVMNPSEIRRKAALSG